MLKFLTNKNWNEIRSIGRIKRKLYLIKYDKLCINKIKWVLLQYNIQYTIHTFINYNINNLIIPITIT